MDYHIIESDSSSPSTDCLLLAVYEGAVLGKAAQLTDAKCGKALSTLLAKGDMKGELGQSLVLYQTPSVSAGRILLIGCGKLSEFDDSAFYQVFATVSKILCDINAQEVSCSLKDFPLKERDDAFKARSMVEALELARYRFETFKTKNIKTTFPLQRFSINATSRSSVTAIERGCKLGKVIASSQCYVRDLGNLPSNICTPTYLAEQAKDLAKKHAALSAKILEREDMEKMKMGALLSVAQGSHQPPKLIILEYRGGKKDDKPIALVGKGVTFDSGGISLKTPALMDEMKFDMCGAASVLGTLKAVAELQLPVNIVGIIPATENMPGGRASKPGDIVTTMSGQTIEILNTDAEGRLILSDALFYATTFNPAVIIDIATLTGAIIVTLGSLASGLMSNNEALVNDLMQASKNCNDKVWPLPMWKEYQKIIDSPIADMVNVGDSAKSITAACLLARFVKDYPWAHLDVAGTAWKSGKEKSATGRPVPLLMQYVLDFAEGKTATYK